MTQARFVRLIQSTWIWGGLGIGIKALDRGWKRLKTGWEQILHGSKLRSVWLELWPLLTGRLVRCFWWHPLSYRSLAILQALVVVQLVLAPVLLFSFPMLYATIGLMVFKGDSYGRVGLEREARWLLMVSLLLAISAVCGTYFHPSDSQFWQWKSGLLLAGLVGAAFSPEFARKVVRYLVFSSIIWLVTGFAQVWAGVPTPTGWVGASQANVVAVRSYSVFGNPNVYAIYLVSLIGLTAGLTRSGRESPPVRIGAGLVLMLASGALYLTYSRIGWLLAAVLLWFWSGTILPVGWRQLVFLTGGLLVSALAGFQARAGDLLLLQDSSLAYRIRIWQGVARALREHWLWGTGPGSFAQVYVDFQIGATPSQHAHSFYGQFWLEYGLAGLATWLLFCRKMWLRSNSNPDDWLLKGTLTAWLGFLGIGLTESWQASRFCSGYFWVLTGILLALSKKEFSA